MRPDEPNDRVPQDETAEPGLPAVSAGTPGRPGTTAGASPAGAVPRVEGYRVLRPLGQGGMGAVWLAHEELLNREVALKFIQGGGGDGPGGAGGGTDDGTRRFLREARAAGLNHPNIAAVYRFGSSGGRAFLAMEYVEAGSPADELRRRGPMPWPVATRAVRDATLALHAAHEAGLVHRDVKPSNLMRAGRGLVKVVDFGLARATATASRPSSRREPASVCIRRRTTPPGRRGSGTPCAWWWTTAASSTGSTGRRSANTPSAAPTGTSASRRPNPQSPRKRRRPMFQTLRHLFGGNEIRPRDSAPGPGRRPGPPPASGWRAGRCTAAATPPRSTTPPTSPAA